ncbi:biotin/lipoyl-binding protein, partial [Alphaproteobacteria bacterium]|nr:biotin/lipoyl-binding protein [Alphaproteobacteria bacterium]
MSIDILMPALSPTMEEGTLSKWLIKEGDQVVSGDLIAEIETDKATMEVETIEDGTVGKLLVHEGEEGIKVNSPIAILLFDGETISDHIKNDDVKEVKKELSKIDSSEDKIPTTSKETSIDNYEDQVIDEKLNSNRIFATPL